MHTHTSGFTVLRVVLDYTQLNEFDFGEKMRFLDSSKCGNYLIETIRKMGIVKQKADFMGSRHRQGWVIV